MTSQEKLETRLKKLEKEIERIKALYKKTIFYQDRDPEVSLGQARKSAEAICKQIYKNENLTKSGKPLEKLMLEDFIRTFTNRKIIPKPMIIHLRTIQAFGNLGSHDQGDASVYIDKEYIQPCLFALGTLFNWYLHNYSKESSSEPLEGLEQESMPETGEKAVDKDVPNLFVVGNHAPPYRIISENNFSGIYFDIITEAANKLDISLRFIGMPFKQALQRMKRGEVDIMVGPNKTPEREKYMFFSETELPAEKKIFLVNPNAAPVLEFNDLKDRILIEGRGREYTTEIPDYDNIKKVSITDYQTAIKMLTESNLYVLVIPQKEGETLLEENDVDLITSPLTISGRPSFVAFSKKSRYEDIWPRIEHTLKEMNQDGSLVDIYNSY